MPRQISATEEINFHGVEREVYDVDTFVEGVREGIKVVLVFPWNKDIAESKLGDIEACGIYGCTVEFDNERVMKIVSPRK